MNAWLFPLNSATSLQVSVTGQNPGSELQTDGIDADFSLALLEALTERAEVGDGTVRFTARGGAKR